VSRAYIEPGDGEKKRHKVTIRCKEVTWQDGFQTSRLEITTNADYNLADPFVMDTDPGMVFTVVIED
jgi:hypothetical protein